MMAAWAAAVAATQRTEVTGMHPYYQTLGYKAADARRAELLDASRGCRHLAGHKLARDESRERAVTEVVHARLIADAGLVSGWRPAIAGMRWRVGAALVGVGTRLQGTTPTDHATAAPAGSGAAS